MPELPEVETVRAGLEPLVSGRRITAVTVLHPRPVRSFPGTPDNFASALTGRRFAVPKRRGKYLWFPFDDGDAMLAHLGMSGQFRLNSASDPLVANTRVLIDLDDGGRASQLRFVDQRMFGGLGLSIAGAALPPEVAHVALDPFDDRFDALAVAHRLVLRRSAVKRALLDQTLISGIGNIYADETLWRERVHADTPADRLSVRKAASLIRTASAVMRDALAEGGTSFDALYVNVNGSSGYFGRSLDAYGREGLPCRRCGTPLVRQAFANRSSFSCPRCQRPGAR